MTPLGKGQGVSDNSKGFASQEAVTALAETLAKRDAEVINICCVLCSSAASHVHQIFSALCLGWIDQSADLFPYPCQLPSVQFLQTHHHDRQHEMTAHGSPF